MGAIALRFLRSYLNSPQPSLSEQKKFRAEVSGIVY
jgi:hypothetical protein